MVSLTPSHLIEHQYCPRYTYFEHVLRIPQNEQKYGKVIRGRTIHDQRLERNKGYLRRRIGVVDRVDDCYLTIPGLRGIIDEVLEFSDNSFAPLDYKFAIWKDKVHNTYRLQLTCYAMLVEANFPGPVRRGFLVYVRSKAKVVPVDIDQTDRDAAYRLIDDCQRVIEKNIFPRGTKNKRQCVTCTYRNVCVG